MEKKKKMERKIKKITFVAQISNIYVPVKFLHFEESCLVKLASVVPCWEINYPALQLC